LPIVQRQQPICSDRRERVPILQRSRPPRSAGAAGPDVEPSWLAGALDPLIGPALSAIHRDPGHDWTVEALARACSLSPSAFAGYTSEAAFSRAFKHRYGTPPARWRRDVRATHS
jgi:AraC-like DNA-binding protein